MKNESGTDTVSRKTVGWRRDVYQKMWFRWDYDIVPLVRLQVIWVRTCSLHYLSITGYLVRTRYPFLSLPFDGEGREGIFVFKLRVRHVEKSVRSIQTQNRRELLLVYLLRMTTEKERGVKLEDKGTLVKGLLDVCSITESETKTVPRMVPIRLVIIFIGSFVWKFSSKTLT